MSIPYQLSFEGYNIHDPGQPLGLKIPSSHQSDGYVWI